MAKNPLSVLKSDFQKDGKFVEVHHLYRYWFNFLALSPSYELARRYRTKKGCLTKADKDRLPADFEKVLKIYDAFGNVQKYLFKTWWVERGVDLFGIEGAPSTTVPIYKFAGGGKSNKADVNEAVVRYLDVTRPKLNWPPALLLAIPIDSTRQKVLKEVKALLDKHIQAPIAPTKPKYALASKGIHMQNIIDAMSVLYIRSARPDWKLWQIGEECKIKKDRKSRCISSDAIVELRALEQMTSRKLKTATYIAENAARGIFPSQSKPKHFVKFDPVEFHQIISENNAWTKKEKTRILAL
ncbi:hypothetical protein [Polynucleobacter yangtzensis]|uniref:hypothetical protein n=1 Tax=Polynucleobacter yangtzensis TaxID=1743159 RepID=UPI0008305418|nr:hypothetical protein [Polynucleobacter yangtzensis]